jgi:signal transduction histidine kinase
MEPKVLEQLFQPLFTTKAPGKGTGLGLASVKAIVEGMGGLIRVASRPGAGTTFTLQFPLQPSGSA